MKKLIFLFIFMSSTVLAQDKWDYSEQVEFTGDKDPATVCLQDGRILGVKFDIPIEEVRGWSPGKKMIFGYNATVGLVLFDPSTGRSLPILSGWEKHPIDTLLGKCLGKDYSTQGMVECYAEAISRWEKEINRLYNILLLNASQEQRTILQDEKNSWITFYDKHKAAIGTFNTEGTISRIDCAIAVMELAKEQALRLTGFIGNY